MRGTQRLWLERMSHLAKDLDLEFSHDPQWANTGMIYYRRAGSFDVVAAVGYDFQDSYASFDVRDHENTEMIPKPYGVGYCSYIKRPNDRTTFEENVRRIEDVIRDLASA